MSSLPTYFRERFPLPVVGALTLGIALTLVGTNSTTKDSFEFNWASPWFYVVPLLFSGIFFFFLLRTRVTDEFKDAGHDDENYPNRPVQRGLISRPTLIRLGLLSFAIELLLVFGLAFVSYNMQSFIWYLAVVGYSGLTAREFFISRWLEKHFNIYLILHQMIFIFFGLWAISVFRAPLDIRAVSGLIGFTLAMVLVEIARKYEIRLSPSGNVVKDTYLAVWGRSGTNVVVILCSIASTWFLYVQSGVEDLWFSTFAVLLGVLLRGKKDAEIRLLIFLNFFFQAVVVYLA